MSIETVNSNNKKLLECLETVIKQLDLPYRHQNALNEPDFSSSRKLRECIQAAKALQTVLESEIEPNLIQMTAVQDQLKRCNKIRSGFSKGIFRHLNNIFTHFGNDTDNLDSGSGQLKLTRRKHIHKELMKYAELVHWMKSMDVNGFEQLQTIYRENLCKLYEKDIRKFFDMARFRISGNKNFNQVAGSISNLSDSGGPSGGGKKGSKSQSGLLGTDTDSIHSDLSLSERER